MKLAFDEEGIEIPYNYPNVHLTEKQKQSGQARQPGGDSRGGNSYGKKAAEFARKVHEGKLRKGSMVPYIVHPFEAAVIVSGMTDDPEVISAALLHDVIEDAGISYEELKMQFGSRVADLVLAESEDKSRTWKERKSATIEKLRSAGRAEKAHLPGRQAEQSKEHCRGHAAPGRWSLAEIPGHR